MNITVIVETTASVLLKIVIVRIVSTMKLSNNFSLAEQFGLESYDISKGLGYPETIEKSAEQLKKVYEAMGNFKRAYEFFDIQLKL